MPVTWEEAMALTPDQLDQFHRDGYIIVPDIFDADTMKAALGEMDTIHYGRSFEEWLAEYDRDPEKAADPKDGFREGGAGRSQFPTGVEALDRLIEDDGYLDVFEQCLGTDEVAYCNAHLFLRSGPTDKRHADNPWEGYHIDHATNCFLPPSPRIGVYDYVNSGVYLHDVDDDCAPMHVIPGSHRALAESMPQMQREGRATGMGSFPDLRKLPEFATPVPSTAKAGSALFYSSYLVHAAVPFQNKRKQRAFWSLSLGRADNASWSKLANIFHFDHRSFGAPFLAKTTPRVRTIFGWPRPGHPYYTPHTLELLSHWWPEMDLSPYRQ